MYRKFIGQGHILPKQPAQFGRLTIDDSVSSADSYGERFALAKDPFRRAADHTDEERRLPRCTAAEMSIHDRGVEIGHDERRNEARGDDRRNSEDHPISTAESDRLAIEDEFGHAIRLEGQGLQAGTKANIRPFHAQPRERRLDEGFREANPGHERTVCDT